MKAFLTLLLRFGAIQMAIAVFIGVSFVIKHPTEAHYMAATLKKRALLANQESPRLIFGGGSATAFGIDSAAISNACGLHPVNMGLHASLGLSFVVSEIKAGLRPGDTVLLSPEHLMFQSPRGAPELLGQQFFISWRSALFLDRTDLKRLLDRGILLRFGRMTRAILGKPGRLFRFKAKVSKDIYVSDSFDDNGDMIMHLGKPGFDVTIDNFAFTYAPEQIQDAIDLLNAFHDHCRRMHVQVWITYPPIPEEAFADHREDLDNLDLLLHEKLRMPILYPIQDAVYPKDLFFDTHYHLNQSGRAKRTEHLIRLLAPKLGSASPPSY